MKKARKPKFRINSDEEEENGDEGQVKKRSKFIDAEAVEGGDGVEAARDTVSYEHVGIELGSQDTDNDEEVRELFTFHNPYGMPIKTEDPMEVPFYNMLCDIACEKTPDHMKTEHAEIVFLMSRWPDIMSHMVDPHDVKVVGLIKKVVEGVSRYEEDSGGPDDFCAATMKPLEVGSHKWTVQVVRGGCHIMNSDGAVVPTEPEVVMESFWVCYGIHRALVAADYLAHFPAMIIKYVEEFIEKQGIDAKDESEVLDADKREEILLSNMRPHRKEFKLACSHMGQLYTMYTKLVKRLTDSRNFVCFSHLDKAGERDKYIKIASDACDDMNWRKHNGFPL